MAVYICADTRFFRNCEDMTKEEYNTKLIENWNKTISNEDYALIVGNFSCGGTTETISLIKELNGHKIFAGYERNNIGIDSQTLQELSYLNLTKGDGYGEAKINGVNQKIIICTNSDTFKKMSKFYRAAPSSISGSDEVFKDRVLNLSIDKWNYVPIKYESVGKLVENYISAFGE